MNFRIVDEHAGSSHSRNSLIARRARQKAGEEFAELARADAPATKVTGWIRDLEEVMEIRRAPDADRYPASWITAIPSAWSVSTRLTRRAKRIARGCGGYSCCSSKSGALHREESAGLHAMTLQFAAFGDAAELRSNARAAFDPPAGGTWPRIRAD